MIWFQHWVASIFRMSNFPKGVPLNKCRSIYLVCVIYHWDAKNMLVFIRLKKALRFTSFSTKIGRDFKNKKWNTYWMLFVKIHTNSVHLFGFNKRFSLCHGVWEQKPTFLYVSTIGICKCDEQYRQSHKQTCREA